MGKDNKQELAITVSKDENISEWFTQLIRKADLVDYTKVSGCLAYKPRSYAMWEKIKDFVDVRFKSVGIENCYFPLFIPESLLQKEEDHVEGFSPEVAWVTHAGDSELKERLAIRPTSETIMYDSYAKWINSHRDLPLRLNQWNSVVRWEFEHATPFLRSREFLWNEGHTVFATQEEAEAERDEILGIYEETLRDLLAIHSIPGQKSEREKFAGAVATYSHECFLPTGKAIQGPDFHLDGQNFAKAFNITFMDEDGKSKHPYQNTFAITTRMIGVMIMVHSDDKGLVVPPRVALNQVAIVPLLFKGKEGPVLEAAEKIKEQLSGFNPILDDDTKDSAGFKFNKWEMRGVPLRIEIGPRDVESGICVAVLRHSGEKVELKLDGDISGSVQSILDSMHDDLYESSKKYIDDNLTVCEDLKTFETSLEAKKWPLVRWCATPECEETIKENYSAKSNNIPFVQPMKAKGDCVFCKKKATCYALIAKGL